MVMDVDCADYSRLYGGGIRSYAELNGQDAAANAAKVTVVADAFLQTSRKSLSRKIT